jgi:hypothetical protein
MLEKAVHANTIVPKEVEVVVPEKQETVQVACQTNPTPSVRSIEQQTSVVKLVSATTQVIKESKDEAVCTDPFVCTSYIEKEEESEVEESRQVTPAEESEESLYFLVQKEKEKYKALLQRTAEEKKRKRQEAAQLRQELDVIKSVLQMAGLHFDYKEYLDAQQRTKTPITVIKNSDLRQKQAALPPIQRKNEDVADQTIQEIHKDATVVYQHSEKLHDYSDLISELTAVPPRDRPHHGARTRPTRPYSADYVDEIPAILAHNQNLDYNNRVHMHLDNVVYKLDNPIITELPPVIEKKIFQKGAVVAPELKKKTNYANRIWRAKIVKEKHLRDLNDKAL